MGVCEGVYVCEGVCVGSSDNTSLIRVWVSEEKPVVCVRMFVCVFDVYERYLIKKDEYVGVSTGRCY